ncbi:MAG: hypothetical protein J7K00_01090 [Candidatus Diapherotrites archaeon]|nr:hypothetical protein [Candidatus Diapherotrites archaeon]
MHNTTQETEELQQIEMELFGTTQRTERFIEETAASNSKSTTGTLTAENILSFLRTKDTATLFKTLRSVSSPGCMCDTPKLTEQLCKAITLRLFNGNPRISESMTNMLIIGKHRYAWSFTELVNVFKFNEECISLIERTAQQTT